MLPECGDRGVGWLAEQRASWWARYDRTVQSPAVLAAIGLGWMALLLVLSPVFGVHWQHLGDVGWRTLMYMHGIFLPLVAVLGLLVAVVLEVPGHIRTLLAWSLPPAIALNGLGSIFNVNPPPHEIAVALWAQIVGFFVLDEIAVALIIGLAMLPRARGKTWWGMGPAFWALVICVASAFVAAIVGHVAGGGISWGKGFYALFPGWLHDIHGIGFKHVSDYVGNLAVAHSHEMLPAVMGGIVALTALVFRYQEQPSARARHVVDAGLVVVVVGELLTAWVYLYSAIGNYAIPTLFASGTGGMNGLAMDDAITGVVALGSLIVLVGLLAMGWQNPAGRWVANAVDPLRGPVLATWVVAVISIAGVGYPIEFHETYYGFGTKGTPPKGGPGWIHDLAFTRSHLLLGFFLMPVVATSFLAVAYFQGRLGRAAGVAHGRIALLAYAGMALGLAGQILWVVTGTQSWLYFIGFALTVVALAFLAFTQAGVAATERVSRDSSALGGRP